MEAEGFTQLALSHDQPNAGDERLYVRFSVEATQDAEASEKEGRPIFRDAEFIEIRVPGDKDNIIVRPAGDGDRSRFRRQYEAFQSGKGEQIVGTPLAAWPAISRAQVEELAHFRVRTVEQLAELSDGNAQNIGPVLALRQRAKDFLAAAKDSAPLSQLRSELEKRDAEMEVMRQALAEQAARIEQLAGRKAKVP